ncbi:hypothetical protein KPL71_021306 [Citrus sinensis]|uniref:Uncharacterized protein n=1 Tax=Citrus sinensis TaxID=2711 RepID=A0ACB8JE73_CITSI|nr:hypothetical protein KPL71_021306 [Citrus sinensis]
MAGNFKKAASLIFFWCTLFTAIRARKLRVIFGPWLGLSMYTIKEERKEISPGLVSCAKVIALAAREGVVLAGGQFYPLDTGRRDSRLAFAVADITKFELLSPNADLPEAPATSASCGFDSREFVTLLGGSGIAVLHCKFFNCRQNLQTSKCGNISSTIKTPSGSASYVEFPSSSADLDGSDFTLSAPPMFFTLIANICGAVNYFIPSIGVIWCTSGVSSNGGTGSGLNPGSNGITGKKRDRSRNYRSWERFQPPQKEYRLEHPRMFLNDQADEGRLFDISINAVLR